MITFIFINLLELVNFVFRNFGMILTKRSIA